MRRVTLLQRVLAWVAIVPTTLLPFCSSAAEAQQRREYLKAREPHYRSELKPGLTQTLTPEQWKKVDAKRAKEAALKEANRPDVRALTAKEMQNKGRGPYRNKYFAGTLPWHRSLKDVNLCNGNLFKSFTDVQVAPAKGAGLALQRTYNSMDDRIGPFGQGWTHAYDLRTEEENPTTNQTDDALNYIDRSDFFAGKHKYHRDADGLYSPPPYLFDETESAYDSFLVSGPIVALEDTERSMDGTAKHFKKFANSPERVCDSITDRYGNATTLTYSQVLIGGVTRNLLQTVTDPSGRQLTFTWADLGTGSPAYRITQVQGPLYLVNYAYNTDLNLSGVTLDPGTGAHVNRTTTFGYTSVSGTKGNETGLLSSVTDALGHSMLYGYGNNPDANILGNAWVSTVSEPAGGGYHTWTIDQPTSAGSSGFPVHATSNGGLVWAGAVDLNLRYYKSYIPGISSTHLTIYDSSNNVAEVHTGREPSEGGYNPNMPPTPTRIDKMTYGPHGNVLTQWLDSNPNEVTTTDYYDGSQYFQKKSITDALGHVSTFGVGNKLGLDPSNSSLPASNGQKGSVLWARDAGYAISTSPSFNKQFNYSYNSNGQKTSETNLNGTITNYTYGDLWGNLTQVVQDPHITQGDSHLSRTTSTNYDIGGKVLTSTDPKGQQSSFSYNILGQPTSSSFPAAGTAPAETVSYGYGLNGRTESVIDNRGTTTMTYENGSERVLSATDPVTGAISYTYTLSGNRKTMTLPGGGTWTYGYWGEQQGGGLSSPSGVGTYYILQGKEDPNSVIPSLQSITDDSGRRVDYIFDAEGAILDAKFNQTFDAQLNLISYGETINDIGQLSNLTDKHRRLFKTQNTWNYKDANSVWHTSTLVQNQYTYDLLSMRLTNNIISSDGTNRTENYFYDELNRLKTVNYGDGQTQGYSFDSMGNRTQKQDFATGTENYSYNSANMLLSRTGNVYTNDADGNTLTGGGRTNTWDSENRLTSCVNGSNTSSFTYGADGLRRRNVVNGVSTDFVLDNSMFIRERRNSVNIATYLVGARGPEYRRDDSNGQVRWYLYDGLGSVLAEVDPSGNVTSSRKYDVYGLVRGGNNPGGTSSHKFMGQLGHPSEDNTGLIYMRARYYDPSTGRFIREDSTRDSYNLFAYCSNNPVNFTDESGHSSDILGVGGRFILGMIFLFIVYLISQLCDRFGVELFSKWLLIGTVSVLGSAITGQYGPKLQNLLKFFKGAEEIEQASLALPGASVAIKSAEAEATVLEAEIFVEEVEAAEQLTLDL